MGLVSLMRSRSCGCEDKPSAPEIDACPAMEGARRAGSVCEEPDTRTAEPPEVATQTGAARGTEARPTRKPSTKATTSEARTVTVNQKTQIHGERQSCWKPLCRMPASATGAPAHSASARRRQSHCCSAQGMATASMAA